MGELRRIREAYGLGDDWCAGLLNDGGIRAPLFHVNQERAVAEKLSH